MKLADSFLSVSVGDLEASKLLYANCQYSLAIYFLQQSIEKAVKAYGLITGAIEAKDCTHDINHKSHRVFKRLITATRVSIETCINDEHLSRQAVALQDQLDIDFQDYLRRVKETEKKFENFHENQFFDLSKEEISDIIQEIEENANVHIDYDDSQIGEFSFQIPGYEGLIRIDDIPNGRVFFREVMRALENQLSTTYSLIYLSLLTFAHNQTTRYPCLTCGEKPEEMYTERFPLVVSYSKIISLSENALKKLAIFIQDSKYQWATN